MQRIQTVGVLLIITMLVLGACGTTTTTTTPPPETVTITPPPETITITLQATTVTVTPPATTVTITPPATTVTVTPTPTPTTYEVDAADSFFNPASITVPVGATVTWTNTGLELHTITTDTGLFNQGIGPGESFSFTFTEPGRYDYYCIPHQADDMVGRVTVE